MDEAVKQIVEAVRSASPALWAAAQGKVRSLMFADVVWALIWTGAFIAGLQARRATAEVCDDAERWLARAATWCVVVFSLAAMVASLADIGCMWLAKDWYTIQALTQLSPVK
jgi:hypothetical protein